MVNIKVCTEEESKWPKIVNLKDLKKLPGGLYICHQCRSFTYFRHDTHRAEKICEHCGTVIKENMMVSENPVTGDSYIEILVDDSDLQDYFRSKNTENDGRVKWLEKQYSETHADKQGWRLRQYHDYIGIVNTHFQMTTYQKDRVWFLIQKAGEIQYFHQKCSYEEIVLALCIGVMKQDKIGRKDAPELSFKKRRPRKAFNDLVDEVGLVEEDYFKVMEKVAFLEGRN